MRFKVDQYVGQVNLAADMICSDVGLKHQAIFASRPEQIRIVAGGRQFLDTLPVTFADHQMAVRAQIVQNQLRISGRRDKQVLTIEFQEFDGKNVSRMIRMKLADLFLFKWIPKNNVAVVTDRTEQRALIVPFDAINATIVSLLVREAIRGARNVFDSTDL